MEEEAGVKRVDEVESHLALDCAEVTVLRGNNDDDAGRSVVFEAVEASRRTAGVLIATKVLHLAADG